MRTRLSVFGAVVALIVAAPAALAADPPVPAYGGPMDGGQENPPVATTATGEATVVISADDSEITYLVTYEGLSGDVVAAHIHVGAVGVNGGIILPLAHGPSPMSGTLTAADFTPSGAITTYAEAVAAIRAGETYVNLHTAANPGGEIRGQVVDKGEAFFASLAGFQENPPVDTDATGEGLVVISEDDSTITYLVTHQGLSGDVVAAHIHVGDVGVNGGIILPLAHGPSPMTGTLTSADFTPSGAITTYEQALAAIRAGGTYINLHTAANPGGEIRGQIGVTVAPPEAPPTTTVTPPPTETVGDTPAADGGIGPLIAMLAIAAILGLGTAHRFAVRRNR